MSKLERENRRNKDLRDNLQNIVIEECRNGCIKHEIIYNVFADGKNTGEQISMPDKELPVFENIISRFSEFAGKEVGATHRNLYL